MKIYLLFVFLFMVMFLEHSAFGQSQKAQEVFPTYTQIKPQNGEIVDHGKGERILRTEPKTRHLFDYPAGTVTYVLNGKSSTNIDYVKQVLFEREPYIDSVTVGKPDRKGNRVIKINYSQP